VRLSQKRLLRQAKNDFLKNDHAGRIYFDLCKVLIIKWIPPERHIVGFFRFSVNPSESVAKYVLQ